MHDIETHTALQDSIEHWEDISNASEPPTMKQIGHSSCALCRVFASDTCEGCPIKERENSHNDPDWHGCEGSPWYDVSHLIRLNGKHFWHTKVGYADNFRAKAAKMRDYLIEMRDNGV